MGLLISFFYSLRGDENQKATSIPILSAMLSKIKSTSDDEKEGYNDELNLSGNT